MSDRPAEELENNRQGLWEMYRVLNPPLGLVDITLLAEHTLWLENGRMHIGTHRDAIVAMWVTFRVFAPTEVTITAPDVQGLDEYIRSGHLTVTEAWLDGEPRNHRPWEVSGNAGKQFPSE